MKTVSSGLLTHIASTRTTLATLWRVTRRDGEVFCFTDHDQPIAYDGQVFEAGSGYTASEVATNGNLSVDNLEVKTFFDGSGITQADVEAGLWDRAQVEVMLINYANTSQGVIAQRIGECGTFTYDGARFTAELRGLMQYLANNIGRVYTTSCDAQLGDARCGVDLESSPSLTQTLTVTAVASRQEFTTGLTDPDNWYRFGVVQWLTGANAGYRMEVKESTDGGIVTLQLPMVYDIEVGDTATIVPGCDKTQATCISKFNNVVNFRGFAEIPGLDKLIISDTDL